MLVFLYLIAIVAANLSVTLFGPRFAVLNSFLFIGLDLTARDSLHDKWKHNRLFLRMAILIASGSILSYALNRNAGIIAIASFTAFMIAGVVDTLVYHLLGERAYLIRVNGSNVVTSIVDSAIFVIIAFGFPVMVDIILLSIAAKIAGGFFWSLVIQWIKGKYDLSLSE